MSILIKLVIIGSIISGVITGNEMILSFAILLGATYIDVTLIDIKHVLEEIRDKV